MVDETKGTLLRLPRDCLRQTRAGDELVLPVFGIFESRSGKRISSGSEARYNPCCTLVHARA